jgi:hypothetical protein
MNKWIKAHGERCDVQLVVPIYQFYGKETPNLKLSQIQQGIVKIRN